MAAPSSINESPQMKEDFLAAMQQGLDTKRSWPANRTRASIIRSIAKTNGTLLCEEAT